MIDYFAVLAEPRRPWLEPAALKDKYYALARRAQPDDKINEAYRVLNDARSRLHHFLVLEGSQIRDSSSDKVPADLIDLFMEIAPVLNQAEPDHRLAEAVQKVTQLNQATLDQVRVVDANWPAARAEVLARLEPLYQRLSYLSRWRDLLRERVLQLSS